MFPPGGISEARAREAGCHYEPNSERQAFLLGDACDAVEVQCGRTRPGRAPVGLPAFQTRAPFTNTFSMPVASAEGFANVERSITVSGLKRTKSAKAPSRMSPRSVQPSRCAGSEVILRTASGRVSQCFSRT